MSFLGFNIPPPLKCLQFSDRFMSGYDYPFTVYETKERKSRAESGRAPRLPPHGEVRRSSRRGTVDGEDLQGFFDAVNRGDLGFTPIPVKSLDEIQSSRKEAAIVDRAVLRFPKAETVSSIYSIVS